MEASVLDSLCEALGVSSDSHFRVIAYMSQTWFQQILDDWKPLGREYTPGEYTQAGLLGRTSRVLCKMEMTAEDTLAASKVTSEHESIMLGLKRQISDLQDKIAEGSMSSKKVKINQVLDQSRDEDIQPLDRKVVQTAYDHFVKIMGGPPSCDEEATADQIAAIRHVVQAGCPSLC